MVEIEVKILNTYISILIDPGACRSYVSPKIVDVCKLGKVKHDKTWLVELVTGTEQKFSDLWLIVLAKVYHVLLFLVYIHQQF